MHVFALNDAILIDKKDKTWTFYNTNIYGQIYNLDEKPKKITKQRINGLIRRLQRFYDPLSGYVVDQYIYHYIMTDEQKEKCKYDVSLRDKLIASGNDLKGVLEETCKYFLKENDLPNKVDKDYYISRLENIA